MTLKDLLKVVDDNTRIQVRIKLFGSSFDTERYKNSFLNDEEAVELLTKEIKSVRATEDGGIGTLVVSLK